MARVPEAAGAASGGPSDSEDPRALRRRRLALGAVVPAALLVGFAGLAVFAAPGVGVWRFDALASALAARVASAPLTVVMVALTTLGDGWVAGPIAAVAAVYLWRRGARRQAETLVAIMLLNVAWTPLVKGLFARPRPSLTTALTETPASASFPSGHALGSALLLGYLAMVLLETIRPGWARSLAVAGLVALAAGVGLSRVYLGVHWLSDVIASWCIAGAALAALAAWSPPGAVSATGAAGERAR